jgi:hypothetical protein
MFVVDRLPISFLPSELGNKLSLQPLVRFKLTTWEKTGDTSLSVAWSHFLGSSEITQLQAHVIHLESQATGQHSMDSCLHGQITTKISALR